MAGITLGKAIKEFSKYGFCSSDDDSREDIIDAITEALEWCLHNGMEGLLREWTVTVRDGRFTLPRDLLSPVKFKFSRFADGGFGVFSSPYFSYGSQGISNCSGYLDWDPSISVKANKVVTSFYPPRCGVRLLLTTTDEKDVGKMAVVGGKQRGFDITPTYKGFKTGGEPLKIFHQDDPEKTYSRFSFDEITSFTKDETCSYVMLSGVDEQEVFYHLGWYHPDDTTVQLTECEMYSCSGWNSFGLGAFNRNCDYTLHILGRINPSIRYVRDEDILPVTSLEILKLLAKRARYDDTGDFNEVNATEQRLRVVIRKQVSYQQQSNRQLSINLKASGLTLSNL
jgi:hypothetical protein